MTEPPKCLDTEGSFQKDVVVVQSLSLVFLQPHGLQNTRLPCPSQSPWVGSNSCPLSWWCHPTISSSVTPFSSCLWYFTASGSSSMNWLSTSGGQRIVASASASVLPMNIQGLFPLGWTGWISLLWLLRNKHYNHFALLLLLSHFSRVCFCETPWTAAHQAPLSTGFSRQEYWSGLPFPSPTVTLPSQG